MLVIDTSSTNRCGATAITPATRSGYAAAYSSAIDPPSLWPNSHGQRSMARCAKSAGSTSCACRCMKSTGQRSAGGRGVDAP